MNLGRFGTNDTGGTINQLGAGTTTLTASNTYAGATTVAAGRLIVDGAIAASAVAVQGTFSIVQNSNDLDLVFTAAGTWVAAALLAAGATFLRLRKRAKTS